MEFLQDGFDQLRRIEVRTGKANCLAASNTSIRNSMRVEQGSCYSSSSSSDPMSSIVAAAFGFQVRQGTLQTGQEVGIVRLLTEELVIDFFVEIQGRLMNTLQHVAKRLLVVPGGCGIRGQQRGITGSASGSASRRCTSHSMARCSRSSICLCAGLWALHRRACGCPVACPSHTRTNWRAVRVTAQEQLDPLIEGFWYGIFSRLVRSPESAFRRQREAIIGAGNLEHCGQPRLNRVTPSDGQVFAAAETRWQPHRAQRIQRVRAAEADAEIGRLYRTLELIHPALHRARQDEVQAVTSVAARQMPRCGPGYPGGRYPHRYHHSCLPG